MAAQSSVTLNDKLKGIEEKIRGFQISPELNIAAL